MSGGIDPTDTHGLPVSSLILSLDHGYMHTNLGADVADLLWAVQRVLGWITLVILNIVSQFGIWLAPLVDLLEKLSDAIYSIAGVIGLFGIACVVGMLVFVTHWLKGTTHRIAHHIGVALILTIVGVAMVSPVRWAVYAIGLGGEGAAEVGQVVSQTPHEISVSQLLATKYLREPMFRANYGANLDAVHLADGSTCGQWYDKAVTAPWQIPDTNPVGEATGSIHMVTPMEAVRDHCGQSFGAQAYAYARNPSNIDFDLLISGALLFVLFGFVIVIAVRIGRTAVATVLHGGFIKPSMIMVVAGPAPQMLMVRNLIAIPVGMLAVFADFLLLVGFAVVNVVAAQTATDNPALAGLLTTLLMAALVFGTWHFVRNLRGRGKKWSEQIAQARIEQHHVSVREAKQMITKTVASPAQISRNLSRAVAATAGKIPVPQFGNGMTMPRNGQVQYATFGSDALSSGYDSAVSPVTAAAKVAETIHQRQAESAQHGPAESMRLESAATDSQSAQRNVQTPTPSTPTAVPSANGKPLPPTARERKTTNIPSLSADATRRAANTAKNIGQRIAKKRP